MALCKSLFAIILLFMIALCSSTEVKNDQQVSFPPPNPEEKKVAQSEQPKPEQPQPTPKAPEKPAETQPDKQPDVEEAHVEVHVEESPKEHQHSEHQAHAPDSSTGRQFAPMYQPSAFNMFPQPSSFNMIRRQFGGGMELLGDIVMMGMIGLPILGLLTVGSSSIANFLGFGSSGSSKSSSKRNRRSLKEKAAGAVEYAKTLWDVMEQLEKAFEKYDLYQAECRLRAVCESHHKVPRMGAWGQTILDLMRKEKELESREILPVSRFLFSNYADAAQAGTRGEDCAQLYTGCPHHLSYYISAKEDEVENEVEVRM